MVLKNSFCCSNIAISYETKNDSWGQYCACRSLIFVQLHSVLWRILKLFYYLHHYQRDLYTASPWKCHMPRPSILNDIYNYSLAVLEYTPHYYCSHLGSHLQISHSKSIKMSQFYEIFAVFQNYYSFWSILCPLECCNYIKWHKTSTKLAIFYLFSYQLTLQYWTFVIKLLLSSFF